MHFALRFILTGILLSPVAFSTITANAEVRMANLFGDNMVLQRDVAIPIWGWSDPGDEVVVFARKQAVAAVADENGKWMVRLKPMAVGDPFSIRVRGSHNEIEIENVVVGEVWICSGQSNMEWTVSRSAQPKEEISAAKFPMIRHVKIKPKFSGSELDDCKTSGWQVCSPSTAGNFTAVGYYFGRKLHNELNVPIGLINSTWGGTIVEAWTSAHSLKTHSDFVERIQKIDANEKKVEAARKWFAAELREWQKRFDDAPDLASDLPVRPVPPGFNGPNHPTALYNAMIHPLVPFACKGAIWYQGEANANRAFQYRSLFPLLILDWRNKWDREVPFYWVQLANFRAVSAMPGPSDWAELREAQSLALKLPKTGEAVIIDIGAAGNIHPKNKQDVGRRLALIALNQDYGFENNCSGPRFRAMEISADKIRLRFDHSKGLKSVDEKPLSQFAIAGSDKKFVWATAVIDGQNVIVSSPKVANPIAVRYAWADNPAGCNLTNASKLPASPFRTDDWPGVTVDVK